MDLYTRRQLALLLLIVLVAGAGMGIDRWRRTHPELAARLEALDRAPTSSSAPIVPPQRAARPEREARSDRDAPPPRDARPLAPSPPAAPVDVNRATRGDLERLPGIGPGLAARIVDSREQRGAFGSVDDLRRVRGIGDVTLARVRPLLAVRPAP